MAPHVALWIVTMETSNQLLGNTGVSTINMRIKETAVLVLQPQNTFSMICSPMQGFLLIITTSVDNRNPPETAAV